MELQFIIATLAVWRITYMVQNESAPFNLFGKLRRKLKIGDYRGYLQTPPGGSLRELVECFLCLSIWVAVPFAAYLATNLLEFIALDLAISAAAIFINGIAQRYGI